MSIIVQNSISATRDQFKMRKFYRSPEYFQKNIALIKQQLIVSPRFWSGEIETQLT